MKVISLLSFTSAIAATAAMATVAPSASAFDFTPQQTGEINVGLGCIDPNACIDPGSIFESIVSLEDSTTGSRSRLFVDYFGAGDEVQKYKQDDKTKVKFLTRDAGTTSDGYWFRPSEYNADGSNEEQGQLEVGTYQFNFAQELEELTIDFFDTERDGETGVLAINGQSITPNYVPKGKDGNIASQTFTNVNSIVIKFGWDKPNGTGDGVDFQLSGKPAPSVPEPATLLGFLAIAGGSLVLKRQVA
ncbi:MAG: LEVG family PEP-CTERM protein [Cyanobacteria bacterium P01_H01_bin.119]